MLATETTTHQPTIMTTIQAPKGGELHRISDKFYKGGQFMPDDNVFAGSRKKAEKKAKWIGEFFRPCIIGLGVYVEISAGNRRLVAVCKSLDEAHMILSDLRRTIEIRLGGEYLDWDS